VLDFPTPIPIRAMAIERAVTDAKMIN